MGDGPNPKAKWSKYKVEDGKLVRAEHCPNCGPGVFLAVHNNRKSCGSGLSLRLLQVKNPQNYQANLKNICHQGF